jgi:tRNA A-37 threonylcarbamoyl transferase component Bud32
MSDFQQLRALFDRFADMPVAERDAEIARATEGDAALEQELRALLEHADGPVTPLDVTLPLAGWREPPLPDVPGFRVLRRIGRGGSATVYLAEQERDDFSRPVALKVVDGLADAPSLWRVREEQRILARLEHAGIARLYDTGVTSLGHPCLVMEHVEGETIVDHCRSRALPLRARIELFLSVLAAVGYAHEQGIVHRDLKPANILVSARGEAKLLDFGIAKLVSAGDDETRTLNRAMTPAYASPEQKRGERITAASDIYSLGIVLEELLDDEAHGDLAAIARKAQQHQPADRYPSAAAFADDLRRALAGQPVTARRGAMRRFVRGHRIALAVSIAIVCATALAIAFLARRPMRSGEALVFYDAASRDSLRRAAAAARGRTPDEALAWDRVARAERELGEVGRAADAARRAAALLSTNAGDLPRDEIARIRALAHAANREWTVAIPALESLFARQPERIDVGMALASALLASGRSDAADAVLGRLRQLPATNGDPRVDLLEAEVTQQLSEYQRAAAAATRARTRAAQVGATAVALRAERIHAEAIGRLDRREEARRALESIVKRDTAAGLHREAAAAQLGLGLVLLRVASAEETQAMLETAQAGLRAAGDERGEITARVVLAIVAGKQGALEQAIASVEKTVVDARRIRDRWLEAYALSQRLTLLNWADREAEAAAALEPALTALRESGNRQLLMATLSNVAILAIQDVELDKAEAYLAEAEMLARRVGGELARATIDSSRGNIDEARGNLDLARERYTAALEKAAAAGGPIASAAYLADLAQLEQAADRPDAAAAHARKAVEAFTAAGDVREAAKVEGVLAWTDAVRGDVRSAERRLAVMRKVARESDSGDTWFPLLTSEARVAGALHDWPRAIALRRRTIRIATEWDARGLRINQQYFLAEALHGAGDRRAFEKLVAEMLPEAERLGMRGIARDLRALQAK